MTPDYFLDHYGTCAADKCACRTQGPWIGRKCPNWQSFGARTPEELGEAQRRPK